MAAKTIRMISLRAVMRPIGVSRMILAETPSSSFCAITMIATIIAVNQESSGKALVA